MNYDEFIKSKSATVASVGLAKSSLSDEMFPHQRAITEWALRRGRAAIFADTGLGKSLCEMEWARVVAGSKGRVIVLAPLAVAQQLVAEGKRFGIAAAYARNDDDEHQIVVTNYEMAHHFDATRFAGVVLDESSILKSCDGKTRTMLIEMFSRTPYRLACTATPAPNDFTELGNHSEFLGIQSRSEMLAEFFVHDGGSTQDWRLKGHAVDPFWRWVSSWGIIIRKPSDLGYDDAGYDLPPLQMHEHVIGVDHRDAWSEGFLFAQPAKGLAEARAMRRATMAKRVAKAKDLVAGKGAAIVWCELNAESSAMASAVDGSVEVKGSDSIDEKTDRLMGFLSGKYRVIVTKPSIAGFGLNWQHCSTMVFVGASYSYEQTYQAIRRCWRFGQTNPVDVHVIRAETEGGVLDVFRRKERDAETLAVEMVSRVRDAIGVKSSGQVHRRWNAYKPTNEVEAPKWLVR